MHREGGWNETYNHVSIHTPQAQKVRFWDICHPRSVAVMISGKLGHCLMFCHLCMTMKH